MDDVETVRRVCECLDRLRGSGMQRRKEYDLIGRRQVVVKDDPTPTRLLPKPGSRYVRRCM